jgi:hypothetical protein
LTENEERFLKLIREKANSLDERAGQFEEHLHGIETEMREIKKSLAYMQHELGEHNEKICRLEDYRKGEMKRDLTFLTEKTAKTEQNLFELKKNL